ncbi:MFS transporter [Melghirimyces algeriensis]|uniref:MFS transporter, NNP family, nitrate/nitrite transporter n=1 Tax=Melghirimyces algeriensis TaxID=910412 RepID=A0A521CNE1_9BACL|nr:nitrate/nitrite transporter [Melghirimyces algeriensis]SMO60967.1 MFS transporter, NNP family, nitrate/nitrite transporter [Melghirimyces algeriensis]
METLKGRTSALWFSTIAMVVSFAVWAVFSPMANTLQEIYRLSATEKSVLVATPVLLGSIMRIPLGILTDRFGGRRVYTLMMLFLTLPMAGAGFADSYAMLLFWAFFIGMAGTTFAIAIAYVSRWYPPEKQGLVLGITGMGNFGTAVAGFTVPTIVASLGVSWAFWTWGILVGMMALLFWLVTQDLPRPPKTRTLKDALSVVQIRDTWVLSFYYFLTFGGFVAFGIYLPTLLQDLFYLTPVDAGLRAAGFVAIATFVRPVGGYLADRWGAGKVLTALFAGILSCALLISFFTENIIAFTLGCLIGGVMLGAGNGAVFKLVPEVAPEQTGAVTGIVGAAGGIGGFFPPILMGMVKDMTGNYFLGFVLLAVYALICLIMNRRLYDRHHGNDSQIKAKWG